MTEPSRTTVEVDGALLAAAAAVLGTAGADETVRAALEAAVGRGPRRPDGPRYPVDPGPDVPRPPFAPPPPPATPYTPPDPGTPYPGLPRPPRRPPEIY